MQSNLKKKKELIFEKYRRLRKEGVDI